LALLEDEVYHIPKYLATSCYYSVLLEEHIIKRLNSLDLLTCLEGTLINFYRMKTHVKEINSYLNQSINSHYKNKNEISLAVKDLIKAGNFTPGYIDELMFAD